MPPAVVGGAIAATGAIGGAIIGASGAKKAASAQAEAADRSAEVQREIFEQSRADLAPFREVGTQALFALADLFGVPRPVDAPATTGQAAEVALPPALDLLDPARPEDEARLRALGIIRGKFGSKDAKRLAQFNQSRLAAQRASADATRAAEAARPSQLTTGFTGFRESPGFQFRLGEGIKALDRSAAARGRLLSGAQIKAVQRFGEGLASQEFENFANRLADLAGIGQGVTTQGVTLANSQSNSIGTSLREAGVARASGFTGAATAIAGGLSGLATQAREGVFAGAGGVQQSASNFASNPVAGQALNDLGIAPLPTLDFKSIFLPGS